MRRLYHLALAVAVLASAAVLSSCRENFQQRCAREASEHTAKYCPQMIDLYQTLDSMTYSAEPAGFNYYYSMSGLMDTVSVYSDEAALLDIKLKMLDGLKSNISMQPYIEHDMTFSYFYRSATTGQLYATIELKPEDYH